jgi:hypothetical protein
MRHTKDEALPFGVAGGLVAIKTLLSRDPCVHANTAIGMIDAILKEHPAAQPAPVQPVAHCEAGPEYCQQCHKESLPTYGSEEVRKLRETIQSQAEIIKGYEAAAFVKPVALEEYYAGLLNDYGGGNVEWWQDYIRAELGRAYEHYQSQIATPPAQPAVPDAMTSADIQEHIEYVAGWNDCRAEMLKGMKP